jgi:tRNA (cytidine/uridine-2'-O-)-methyltransferase
MFHIVLFEPEIPPNTGNIIRLCANTGAQLHLVKPLGFKLDDKQLVRAGLDYHEFADMKQHFDWPACTDHFKGQRLFAVTTKGKQLYTQAEYVPGDVFVFGPESRGLPQPILETFPPAQRLRLPMLPQSRSLNLSNAVAVFLYEAWRQQQFKDGI